ncbi:MAG: hypothetical protein ACXV8U_20785 [Methylobacter sp.]
MKKYLIGRRVPVIERLMLEITVNRCAQRQDRHPQRRGHPAGPRQKFCGKNELQLIAKKYTA